MGLDSTHIEAVLIDSYSTLVDVESTREALQPYTADPTAVARIWQLRSREYAIVGNAVGVYRPATERHRLALEYALDVYDVNIPESEREEILTSYHDLDAYDDVRDGLEMIHDAGRDIYILSNGDPELLESLVSTTCLGDIIMDTISADEIATYKPATKLYSHAASRVGVQPENLLHVTTSWSDVNGGLHAGLQVAWLNRKGRAWESYAREPDAIVKNLYELADLLPEPQ